jgi:hypothetical protein
MKKTKANLHLEQLVKAQSSWRGKFIRDTRVNEYGLVKDVTIDDQDSKEDYLALVAVFPSDPQKQRLISLEPKKDLECLVPTLSRARYRRASKEEVLSKNKKSTPTH